MKITTDNRGRRLVSGREIHEFLEVGKNFTSWVKGRIDKYKFLENIDYSTVWSDKNNNVIEYSGNSNQMSAKGYSINYFLTVETAIAVVDTEKFNPKRVQLLEYLYKNNNFTKIKIKDVPRKELSFLNKLKEVLKPFQYSLNKQERVFNGKYRIDYYIPELNIAIEYDENGHIGYTYKRQEYRQKKIEETLGCKFIRVSDRNSDEYNIGFILKEITNT